MTGHPMKTKKHEPDTGADKARLLARPSGSRPCIHTIKGHIPFRTCPQAYRCIDCEFDQYFHDRFKVRARLAPVDFENVGGIFLPAGFYLHPGHVWARIEDRGTVRIGIDDFAARLLGPPDQSILPLIGEKRRRGETAFVLSRQGHELPFVSPVSGIVLEINPDIYRTPGRISDSPYLDGWVMMLYCPTLKQDVKPLLFMDEGRAFMEAQVKRLYDFLERETGLKAADGGDLMPDLFAALHGSAREKLLSLLSPEGL